LKLQEIIVNLLEKMAKSTFFALKNVKFDKKSSLHNHIFPVFPLLFSKKSVATCFTTDGDTQILNELISQYVRCRVGNPSY